MRTFPRSSVGVLVYATSIDTDDGVNHLHKQSITQLVTFHTLNKRMPHQTKPAMAHSHLKPKNITSKDIANTPHCLHFTPLTKE